MTVVKETDVTTPELDEGEVISRGRLVWRRFLRRKLAVGRIAVIALLFLAAFLAPHLIRWSYQDRDLVHGLEGPSWRHLFGTTQLGQDVFAQTMTGLQKSLVIGLLTAFFSTGFAALAGSCAGYFGGWVDRIIMSFVDLLLVLPSFLIIALMSPRFRGKTWLLFVV